MVGEAQLMLKITLCGTKVFDPIKTLENFKEKIVKHIIKNVVEVLDNLWVFKYLHSKPCGWPHFAIMLTKSQEAFILVIVIHYTYATPNASTTFVAIPSSLFSVRN